MNNLFENDTAFLLKEYHRIMDEMLDLIKKCSKLDRAYIVGQLQALTEILEKEINE
ncbi:hypothetical protein [Bacteroides sp. 51]|uniref:hypothetical protein n=1 Tax=Bacteroides sp. 51 TaxID=2302938 RepID=UPI0013D69E3A|nr:hypothetical protein [Bacteroides sp. 51]